MVELAEQVGMIPPGELARLPTGVIVGSAVAERWRRSGGRVWILEFRVWETNCVRRPRLRRTL